MICINTFRRKQNGEMNDEEVDGDIIQRKDRTRSNA